MYTYITVLARRSSFIKSEGGDNSLDEWGIK